MINVIIPGIKKRSRLLLLTGALFLFVVLAVLAWNLNFEKKSADPLTAAERTWLKAHPVIRLAPDPDFPPVEFLDKNDKYSGITADYVALIEKKLGIHIEIVHLRNWDEIISKAKSRQIDAYVATKTPQRAEYLLFTKPFLEFPVVIITREKVKSPLTLEKLHGMKVSVVSEYAAHNLIAYNYPKLHLDLVPDVQTGLRKVAFGLSDAFVENLATVTYYIEKGGITNLRIAGESGYFYRMGFCTRKDWPELNSILEKGLAEISADEQKAIYKKWIPVEPRSLFTSREFKTGVVVAVAAILLIVVGFIAWNRALAQQVRLRTGELEKELAERKRMEEELECARDGLEKRVEERTGELAETVQALRFTQFAVDRSTDQAFWITNDGQFFYVNDAACHALGYTRDELLTMSVTDIDPECPPEMVVHYWQVLRENGADTFEACHRAKDGRVYPVEIRSNLLAFEGKEYNCCFVTDITARKRDEEALRESGARLKMAMDLAKLVQWEYDVESGMFIFNDQFYALYGTTAEREGGTLLSAQDYARKFIPSEDSAVVAAGIEELLANPSNQLEHRIIRADGEERFIVVRGEAVRDETGCIVKLRGANQDITERKRMEELLRKGEAAQRSLASELARKNNFLHTLINALPDLIFYKDCNMAYLGCNRAFEVFAGRAEKDLVRRTDLDIFSKDVADAFREIDHEILSTEESRRNDEWIVYPDGRRVLLETLKTPFFDLDGKVLGIVAVSRDITERKRAEEALRESESRVSRKLESILDPEGDTGELELADILNAPEIQALMADLYRITGLKMSIIDLQGRVLVDVGWQDICSRFHRNHPETLRKCHESDTDLTVGVPQGEFKTYRCKNNIWHIVTPIFVGGRHMGNLFLGQFFFADELLDYDLFRAQARTYGFPEEEYLAALEAVPRQSEERVNFGKAVFLRLTDMFSKLSYANIKLAHSLAERDRLTATLRQANMVVENSPVVLFRCKAAPGWPVEMVSRNVVQFGYAPEEFLSGELTYSSIVHPEDLGRLIAETEEYCATGEGQLLQEHRIVTKGGDIRWIINESGYERNEEGELIYLEGIIIDVTEWKEAEEELREANLVVENSPVVLFRWKGDDEWPVELVSGNIIQFGYTPDEFLSGSITYSEVVHPGDLERVTREVHDFCAEGADQFRLEYRIMTKGGDIRWVNEHSNVERDAAGGVKNFEGIVIDVTDRKLFEDELQRQKKLLQELNETLEQRVGKEVANNREKDIMLIQQNRQAALGELLDHIAHQWKQPLTSLSLVIQDLGDTASAGQLTDHHVKETVSISMALLDHMIQTMDVFRGYYRPDKEKKVFSVKDSIDQALAFISPSFMFYSIAVEIDVDPGLTVFGYSKEYTQVLLNILANARDVFSARGTEKPRVTIKAFADGARSVVTVTDNAGGIPEAIIGKIFDFYFTTNESSGGTGIGLYMSKNIIEKNMAGKLSAQNVAGGAQFLIEISPT